MNIRQTIRKSTLYRWLTLPTRTARILLVRGTFHQVIVHNAKYSRNLPPQWLIRLFCGPNRGRFTKPANLAILLVHNRAQKTLMELSLDWLGIEDYTVLRVDPSRPWTHTTRITKLLEHLRSGECDAEYVLSTDCDDAFLRDDPQKAINLLDRAACEMLVSSSTYTLYRNMPEVRRQTETLAPEEFRRGKRPRVHLNAGVYITRTAFLREYLEEASKYVTENDLQSQKLLGVSDAELLARLPEFPKGFGSDQAIMRMLFPRFYPRMQIDYRSEFVSR